VSVHSRLNGNDCIMCLSTVFATDCLLLIRANTREIQKEWILINHPVKDKLQLTNIKLHRVISASRVKDQLQLTSIKLHRVLSASRAKKCSG